MNQIPEGGSASSSLPLGEARSPQADDNPFAKPVEPKAESVSPYAAPMTYSSSHGTAGGYQTPHRGGLVLTMGILSLFCNFFLVPGILAWTLGSSDLKRMKAGEMDPSGYGTTQAGMIIGIIATCLFILGILFYVAMLILVFGFAAANANLP